MDGVNLNSITNGGAVLTTINTDLQKVQDNVAKTIKVFGNLYTSLSSISIPAKDIAELSKMLDKVIAPGIALNTQMKDLSTITGLTGQGLKNIEKAARESARTFGTDASQNVSTYKLILSQLSPEIAKSSEAIKLMGNNVNILAKTMGGNTTAATEVLTTAMNQYGVDLDNPIQASKTMADMMNVMAAAAKEGSAGLPQIKQALEQVGTAAKTTGVSFVDTNAAIQMLDKAGKKGAEGGMALRNVLITLSESRFSSKDAAVALQAVGISTSKLADASIPLTDRLRMLRPVMHDTALMAKVFGKENMAASIALIESADTQDALAKKITGTNTAASQANVVMGGYQERMNRATALIQDWRIALFDATEAFRPYIQKAKDFIKSADEMKEGYMAIRNTLEALLPKLFAKTAATEADTVATAESAAVTGAGSIINKIYAATIGSITRANIRATASQIALNLAMLNNPVGWVVAGVLALVAVFKYLWDHSKRFREILFGIWEAAKAVFHNIGVVIKRVWDMVVKPIIMGYYTLYKFVFTKIWDFIKWVFNGIAAVFVWLYEQAVAVFTTVKDFVVGVFNWIVTQVSGALSVVGSFFSGLWEWFSSVFSGFVGFINKWLVQPIKDAFGGIWDWITGLFEKIMDKITGVFAPIKKFFKTLFSSEGMIDVNEAKKEGNKKGAVSFDASQAEKEKTEEVETGGILDAKKSKGLFGVPKVAIVPATKPIAGVGAKNSKESSGSSGPRSLTIGKLIENMTLHFHGTVKESKESIKQSITEVLLTSVNDVNLAN